MGTNHHHKFYSQYKLILTICKLSLFHYLYVFKSKYVTIKYLKYIKYHNIHISLSKLCAEEDMSISIYKLINYDTKNLVK